MPRQCKHINAILGVKENKSRSMEEKEEACFPDRDQETCKVTESKITVASEKENFSDRNQVPLQRPTLKYTKDLEKESYHNCKDIVNSQLTECFFDTLNRDTFGESILPLSNKDNFSKSRPVSLGNERSLVPNRDKAEEKSDCGKSEQLKRKPVDFATVTIAEFGITPESFTKQSVGKSPSLSKFRRRSTIGVRGSPENNSLIRYLAQQRASRQKELSAQTSPFNYQNAGSFKDKICAFQTSFKSVQEDEGEIGPSQVTDAFQEANYYFSPDYVTKEDRNNATSDLTRKKVSFAEELSLQTYDETKVPVTPLQRGNILSQEHTQSGSRIRSVLKRTPVKQVMDGSVKVYFKFTKQSIYALKIEKTEQHGSEKQKKKRVTFGEDLSPEIFDRTLPASTPLHKGATPVRHPGSQSNSPFTGSSLTEEPLSQPNFDCSDESLLKGTEPLQELMEDYVAPEGFLSAENKEETDRSSKRVIRSCTKRKYGTISEETDSSISKATSAKNTSSAKNPRKSKFQRQKSRTISDAEKAPRVKRTSYGKRRRKKKVKKSLYGEREMASKKPLLSPIPEIPEVFSSASSPNTPKQMQDNHKTNVVFPGNGLLNDFKSSNTYEDVQQKKVVERMKGKNIDIIHTCPSSKELDTVEASSSQDALFEAAGDSKSASSFDYQFSNTVVPEAKCIFDTPEQGQESACIEEEKEEKNNSLTENKKLQGNFLNKAEPLTRLEFLELQDTGVHKDAQRMECSPKDCSRGKPPRKERNSPVCTSYIKNLDFGASGNNFSISSFNVEEVLSAAHLKNDSLEESFRMSNASDGKRRVRRSMRLHKDAETEGLAWIQAPDEIQMKPQLLASCCKIRRRATLSVLKVSENVHGREENLTEFSAQGKENNNSVHLADGSCKRQRRRSLRIFTPQETRNEAQLQKRSIADLGNKKDRSNRKPYDEVEISLEN
ncbi:PREDICTED: cell division cycle-associated protein 2 [Tinamus guttatus]|nr:PREDICTED: cell division cycle-associated protein 2 [Tinamus guttatus]